MSPFPTQASDASQREQVSDADRTAGTSEAATQQVTDDITSHGKQSDDIEAGAGTEGSEEKGVPVSDTLKPEAQSPVAASIVDDHLHLDVKATELPPGVKAPPARTVVFSRVPANPANPSSTTTRAAPPIATSAIRTTTTVVNNATSVAGTAATGIASVAAAAARVARNAASAARAVTASDHGEEGALSAASLSTPAQTSAETSHTPSGDGAAKTPAAAASTAAAFYAAADAAMKAREHPTEAESEAALSEDPAPPAASSHTIEAAKEDLQSTQEASGTTPADDGAAAGPVESSVGVEPSDSATVDGASTIPGTRRRKPSSFKDEGGTAQSSTGIALNDVSGSVHELKQALLCQLKGMVLQLECLRKCDAVLSVKCDAQARAASALRTFSQDVVRATKQVDGLAAVESKLKQLTSAVASIEQQLDHLEGSQKQLLASPSNPELE